MPAAGSVGRRTTSKHPSQNNTKSTATTLYLSVVPTEYRYSFTVPTYISRMITIIVFMTFSLHLIIVSNRSVTYFYHLSTKATMVEYDMYRRISLKVVWI